MLLTIGSVTLATNASAASFDCNKASTRIEHVICDDVYLNAEDREMGYEYKNASKHVNLKHSQRDWIKHRNRNCGTDADCLVEMTRDRIEELEHIAKRGGKSHKRKQKAHHKNVYSPVQGVVCDRKSGFCADSYGISAGLTNEYLGQDAENKFFNPARMGNNYDTTIFGMINGVFCDSNARTCYQDKLKDKVDHYFTNRLYR